MKVTIQKTMNVPDPVRAHDTDAGLDLCVPEGQGCLVRPGAVYTIDLGVRVAIPDGYYGQLALRSSAGKKGLTIPNGVGVIDSGYRGNVKLLVASLAEPILVNARERICQLIILPLPAVTWESGAVDDGTDRGQGGFGSTGTGAATRDYANPEARPTHSRHGRERAQRRPGPAARRHHRHPHGSDPMNNKERKKNDRIHLTVGGLMRELQEIALRYGNDTPIVTPTSADADYEQAVAPFIMHARREPVPDDWDLFHVEPDGGAVAVIS
jgi:dUTP pyrophosphatase